MRAAQNCHFLRRNVLFPSADSSPLGVYETRTRSESWGRQYNIGVVAQREPPSGADSGYKTVNLKLCYAPISQKDRAWRKTVDDLAKDKTCQHKIASQAYSSSSSTFTWTLQKDVPTGTYFVRAYVHNSADEVVAYGQTTDAHKATNLFDIQAISGRHVSLDIAAVCFSAFSVVSLFGFFFLEKRKSKSSQQK
ncbi:High-affinity nitrate transporter 3.1 [Sesamum angolense]|uniref:High-affinity nitrate transporter 3.1 n=1 Tax=Sesamum angolense TaxID=2727404 RepID=A0AAE1WKF6_9LAMI|nr:High-affinity nitrate transporter 3.1 [Sesamum angolense]